MVDTLIAQFLSQTPITTSELFESFELQPTIHVGGSIDAYHNGIIYDFKTMGSLDTARIPQKVPRSYWFQQYTYAWILRKRGYDVHTLKLVYVTRNNTGRYNDKGKPLKDYPSEVHVLTEPISSDSLNIIDSTLNLIAESVLAWQKHPELRHLLAQDLRLKTPATPILFKD
jgi:hypothetical protein